ncbi:MAG: hypothetical protein WDM80_14725 [Limisphaerales bacterium]
MRRVSAYVAGSLFIALGIMGFIVEFSEGKSSSSIIAGYVMATMFFVWGVLLCSAVKLHYCGGVWSLVGITFVALAIIRAAFLLDIYLRGSHLIFSVLQFSLVAAFWGVGCYCLIWGHVRHHRKKKSPNTRLEPAATSP